MSELREQVRLQVSTVYAWGRIEEAGTLPSPPTIIADTTDRILALVAEAITGVSAMAAARDAVEDVYDDGYQTGLNRSEHTLNYNQWAKKIVDSVAAAGIDAGEGEGQGRGSMRWM